MLKIAVITISDRAWRGEYSDRSGPAVQKVMREMFPDAEISAAVVADEKEHIAAALAQHTGKDYIFTTGGTGISPRDITPEVTREFCQRELPGIAEWLRRESLAETPFAVFSRGVAGVRDHTIVVNFPGSQKAAEFCARLISPVLSHGADMIRGAGHDG